MRYHYYLVAYKHPDGDVRTYCDKRDKMDMIKEFTEVLNYPILSITRINKKIARKIWRQKRP